MRAIHFLLLSLVAGPAAAGEHVVLQKDKAFNLVELDARVGDTLRFENQDPFFHNIFSLSDAQSFDLGSFGKGESRTIKLEAEGTVEVECAIHPGMKMRVNVKK
jgi:plastocyanin